MTRQRNRHKYTLRRPLTGAILVALAATAQAAPPADELPTGGAVVSGAAAISIPDTARMVINQTTTGAIVNWTSFSIGQSASVTFNHVDSSGVTLNRVMTTVPSEIFGALNANGRVFLINPNGVLFGETARVSVGGLVASTIAISDPDFLGGVANGSFIFDSGSNTSVGFVENYGELVAASGGTIALLGGDITNAGAIIADLGTVVLASSRQVTLDFFGDGLTQVSIGLGAGDRRISNEGLLQADGGNVLLRTQTDAGHSDSSGGYLHHNGIIRARTLQNRGGRIVLDAGAGVLEVGTGYSDTGILGAVVDATGPGASESGGDIELRAAQVTIAGLSDSAAGADNPTLIDASGTTGGGRIVIDSLFQTWLESYNFDTPDDVPLVLRSDALGSGRGGSISFNNRDLNSRTSILLSGPIRVQARGFGTASGGEVSLATEQGGILLYDNPNSTISGPIEIDASGVSGGGSIALLADNGPIGIEAGTVLRANATGNGDGGSIRAFGSTGLRAYGQFSARGGTAGGNGGWIETSGGGVQLSGIGIDAGAPQGVAGTWLIDPYDVFIVHGNASGSLPSNPLDPVGDSYIQDGDINNALDAGTSVHITTGDPATGDSNGDIVFLSDPDPVHIVRSNGTAELSFRLDAHRGIRTDIHINGSTPVEGVTIDGGGGPLHVLFNADANATANPNSDDAGIHLTNATILSRGGNVWFYGQDNPDQGVATSEEGGIRLQSSSIDTRDATGSGGEVRLRGLGGYDPGVALYESTIFSGGGGQQLFGRNLFGGDGVVLASGSGLHGAGGDIRITGVGTTTSSFPRDAYGVTVQSSQVTSDGGSIEIAGRASSTASASYADQAAGVFLGAGTRIGGAATSRVRIVGESSATNGEQAGILLYTSDSSVCGDTGPCVAAEEIVLQAATSDGSPAIVFGEEVAASRIINLRPGGVDVNGNVYERPDDPISIGGSAGFVLDPGDFQRIIAPDVVLGSDIQTGLIDVEQPLQRVGNLSLQAGGSDAEGIWIDAALNVDGYTLALVSAGRIGQGTSGAITAESLLARSTGGDVLLDNPANDVSGNTLAGDAAGEFHYVDTSALAIGDVDALGFAAADNTPQALSATGLAAGDDVLIQNLAGDLTLAADVSAGNDITLVTAGTLQNTGGATLDAGNLWRVWADTWVGETRGGLAGSGPLPNLYGCAYDSSSCSVTVSDTDNQFIYTQQPTATVVIGSHSREYGLDNPTFGFDVDGVILDDIAANVIVGDVSTTATITSNVGQYPIDGSFTSPAGYVISLTPGTLDVSPAMLLYLADPYSRVYGDPEGLLSGTVTGFRNGETLADATTGTLAFASDTGPTTPVGTYAIFGSGLSAGNYVFEQAPGNASAYQITPATLLYLADPYSRVYGDPEGLLSGTVTGLRNGETLADATTGTLAFASDTAPTTPVGTYAIFGSGLSAGNYVFEQAPGNATAYQITPATLLYVADPYSRLVGQPNGFFGGTVTGLRNGETLADATTGTLAFASPADRFARVGIYPILGSGLSATNYVFEQAPGNAVALTVFGLQGTLFATELVRQPQDNYLYDRNLGMAPICPVVSDLLRTSATDEGDMLAREWSRVKTRPNLTNCIQGNRRNGCDDF
ncbi:MBG domain-containing protein [Pseudoxanthomonas suwonensis]|uniref:Filamentous haemagglutinin FhaB/tRNA nuclease CdiA-like TPS domain-containing protein n=1 Tax=Pseudoxanthomonas suwonensis TaxID=314722 RepID=A0A0E3Z085_9GAMM|nr:MBG domain-containing protein [Pseudoxanthomonas suwonensis]AKC85897.1 hypothetical protein WQ53_03100 [Pseudoxanthomonas suwonensis]